jgi:hypothetical protein
MVLTAANTRRRAARANRNAKTGAENGADAVILKLTKQPREKPVDKNGNHNQIFRISEIICLSFFFLDLTATITAAQLTCGDFWLKSYNGVKNYNCF